MGKKAKWGGYVNVRYTPAVKEEIERRLDARMPPDKGLEDCVRDLLDAGFTLRLSLYRGAVNCSAVESPEKESGVQFAVSAFGPTTEWGVWLCWVKAILISGGTLSGEEGEEEMPSFG